MIATVERPTAPKTSKRRAAAEASSANVEQAGERLRTHTALLAEVCVRARVLLGEHPDRSFAAEEVVAAIEMPQARPDTVGEELDRLAAEGTIDAQISGGRWTYRASSAVVASLLHGTPRADALAFLVRLWGCSEPEAQERAVRFAATYYRAMTENDHA